MIIRLNHERFLARVTKRMAWRVLKGLVMTAWLLPGFAVAGDAKTPRGVVELFTSQGCASCPPADAAFEKLATRDDIVALAYHVDYWNYLGWSDTLGSKENTARQYAYARALGRSNVYTPQAVVNGREHMNGADLPTISDRMDGMNRAGNGLVVPVTAAMKGGELDIAIGEGTGRANVVIAYFRREQTVEVLKGENKGRKANYWNAVYDLQTVGMWDGTPLELTLPASVIKGTEKDGCAVLLQSADERGAPAAILGATMLVYHETH